MTPEELSAAIKEHVQGSYPDMEVRVEEAGADHPRRVYFTDPLFAALYPLQRFHYLIHLLPQEFYEEHLGEAEWYELAPGETPQDLRYPDDEFVEGISEEVLKVVQDARFFEKLDDLFSPTEPGAEPVACYGDFRHSKALLAALKFSEQETWDVAHVMMHHGAYCDCEILYNVLEESRTKASYWKARAEQQGALGLTGDEHGHDHDHAHGHGHSH